jgi:threonine synthase
MRFAGYRCSACGAEYGPQESLYLCPRDGGCLEVVQDRERIRRECDPGRWRGFGTEPSHWRYLPLLPVAEPGGRGTAFRRVGCTPLYELPALRARRHLRQLWLKDEGRNPTASLKDRASSLVVARAREIEAPMLVTASTGNAGAALAGMAACLGVPAVILAPRDAPRAKIVQMLIYGARVMLVEGSYDQASALAVEASRELGWHCRNTGYNPFSAEGKKTAALEIWESLCLGELRSGGGGALCIFVPVGDGNIIAGVHKGFRDLQELGWLEQMPRLFGVQAEGSAAIAAAFRQGTEQIQRVRAQTVADSICVDQPADGLRALRAARATGGAYLTVSDERILGAVAELGQAGVFAEPAAAAAYAGALAAVEQGLVGTEEPLLLLCTGSGLKDVPAAERVAAEAPVIEPTLAALRRQLSS